MLTVACVKVGSLYGADYVNTLFDMVRRNLPSGFPGRFVCFTDDATGLDPAILVQKVLPDLPGWWAKLWLFSKDAFPDGGRVLYFDLDTVICGPLDAIAQCQSDFAILRDAYRPDGMQSAVMSWDAGKFHFVWENWLAAGQPKPEGGDQSWIETQVQANRMQDIYPGKLRSYKVECRTQIPRGTSVVFFHGHPRPHEVTSGWVPEVWKIGGGSGIEWIVQSNVSDEALRSNVLRAIGCETRWLTPKEPTEQVALIVGGGPSLAEYVFYVNGMQRAGHKVFATNAAYGYLKTHGVMPDAHVMLDARAENAAFVPKEGCEKYYASQCHPSVFTPDAICWHAAMTGYQDLVKDQLQVGGGTTVGLKAVALAYVLGHRTFRLFGFDSCYAVQDISMRADDCHSGYTPLKVDGLYHHAYPQPLNDGERILDLTVAGRKFSCAPWMVTQAEDFKELSSLLVERGCTLRIYGEGLIPYLASLMKPPAVDDRYRQLVTWLQDIEKPVGAEIGVFRGELSQRLLQHPWLKLYLVDSWEEAAPDSSYAKSGDFHAGLSGFEQTQHFEATLRAVEFAKERAIVLKMPSTLAASRVADGSLDFVFIDADHSYEGCKADIEAWLPKLKPTGFLSGHDYDNPDFPAFGVRKAVSEFGEPELGANYTWRIARERIYERRAA